MQAIGYSQIGPATVLTSQDIEQPKAGPRDLLVAVKGISVNPVDVKLRAARKPETFDVLGFDAAGVVVAVGAEVTGYKPGDEVFYAGDVTRARKQWRTPRGRRADRRTQACIYGFRGGSRDAADFDHGLGIAVRQFPPV